MATWRIAVVIIGVSVLRSDGLAQSSFIQSLAVAGAANATPSLAASGRTVAAVWTATKDGAANVYLATSADGGATFSPPRRVNDQEGDAGATSEQPPRVVITGAGPAQKITVMWSKRDTGPMDTRRDVLRIAHSTDGGRTFAPARYTHDPSLSGARGWEALTVAANGTVHAVWLDGREAARKIAALSHKGMPHKGQPPQEIYHGTLAADGRMIETRIAEDVCFCCKTAVAVDSRGRVHVAWRHVFPESMRDIAFAVSSDGGRQFGPIVRVSHDNWQLNGCPEDGPSLAVDSSGTIHIAWATVVNAGEPRKAVFYAASRDGKTFSRRARIATAAEITPGHPQMALMANGGAVIVFDEAATGIRRVSMARVSRTGEPGAAEVLSGEESASHPVIVSTPPGGALVAWTSRTGDAAAASTIRVRRID